MNPYVLLNYNMQTFFNKSKGNLIPPRAHVGTMRSFHVYKGVVQGQLLFLHLHHICRVDFIIAARCRDPKWTQNVNEIVEK